MWTAAAPFYRVSNIFPIIPSIELTVLPQVQPLSVYLGLGKKAELNFSLLWPARVSSLQLAVSSQSSWYSNMSLSTLDELDDDLPDIFPGEIVHNDNGDNSFKVINQVQSEHWEEKLIGPGYTLLKEVF